jgi:hypothetical protein
MYVLYVKMENYNKSIKKKKKKKITTLYEQLQNPIWGLVVVVGCERIKVKMNTVVPL